MDQTESLWYNVQIDLTTKGYNLYNYKLFFFIMTLIMILGRLMFLDCSQKR